MKESRLHVKPWITKGLLASIANKNKLYKSYLKSRNSYFLSKFKYYRYKLKHLILISKKSYYSSYFLRNKDNIKGVWKGIKELITIKNSNNHMPTTLEIGNLKVTNRQSIVNAFNDYFANIGMLLKLYQLLILHLSNTCLTHCAIVLLCFLLLHMRSLMKSTI